MEAFANILQNLHVNQVGPGVAVPVLLVWGLVSLMFGYRLYKAYLFFVGFVIGCSLAGLYLKPDAVGILAMLAAGAVCGALCVVLWFIGLFLMGFAIGFLLPMALGAPAAFLPLNIVLGVVCGVLAVVLNRFMIVLSTSWSGAGSLVAAGSLMVGETPSPAAEIALMVTLTGLGFLFQYVILPVRKPVRPAPAPAPATPAAPVADPAAPSEPPCPPVAG